MKRLLLILILTFSFQTLIKADEIRDFEVEGMSVGDSALDYFSKEYLIEGLKNKSNKRKNKFQRVWIRDREFNSYQYVSITLKKEDSSYFIYGIAGMFDINREDECLIKKESIESELSKVFNKSKMTHSDVASKQDSTGKSRVVGTYFHLKDGGNASVQCYLFTKEANLKSGLDVTIRSEELSKYLRSL